MILRVMVALNPAYIASLVGPGRLGFVATNGLHDAVVIEGVQEDEYRRRIDEGWRVVEVRPICRSLTPKLIHTREELQGTRVFSYVLVVLEHPARKLADSKPAPAAPRG
jgi:hypothetical protein